MQQFSIELIGSSSKGNAIQYDNKIMIDIGLPYSKLKEALSKTKLVLLTHVHSDHINDNTVRKIIVNHENIIFGCCEWLEDKLLNLGVPKERLHIYEIGRLYNYQTYVIAPIKLYHDVQNCGYRIIRVEDNYKHIHMTDTYTVEGISAKEYDSAVIECNYCENRIKELIEIAKEREEYTHLINSEYSHLSVQQALDFVINNNIKKIVPAHMSDSTIHEVKTIIGKFKDYS